MTVTVCVDKVERLLVTYLVQFFLQNFMLNLEYYIKEKIQSSLVVCKEHF